MIKSFSIDEIKNANTSKTLKLLKPLVKKHQRRKYGAKNHKNANAKNAKNTNNIKKTKKQSGGATQNYIIDNFEIRDMQDIDLDRYKISKYVNANIDWGMMPGAPPTDCIIL